MLTNNSTTILTDEVDIELGTMNQDEPLETTDAAVINQSVIPSSQFLTELFKLNFSEKNRMRVSLALLLSCANTGFSLLAPIYLAETIQALNNNASLSTVKPLIGKFVAICLAAQFTPNLVSWLLAQPTANNSQIILKDCMEHQLKKSLNYYLQMPTRKHTNVMDYGFITGAFLFPALMTMAPTLIQLILADVYFFSRYGLEVGFSIPVLIVANMIYGTFTGLQILQISAKYNEGQNELKESMTELIKSYKTMRDFCRTPYAIEQFNQKVSNWIPSYQNYLIVQARSKMGQTIIAYAHMFWVAWHIGTRIRTNQYTVQDFIVAVSYLQQLSALLPGFAETFSNTLAFTPCANMVFEELKKPDEVIDQHPSIPFPDRTEAPSIAFDHLTYYHPKRANETVGKLAFSDLSFNIASRSRVAIVTESGVGKTTLFNLIFGYDKATRGTIRINDQDIMQISLDALQKNITIFEQNPNLFKGSLRDNICYAADNPDTVTDEMIWSLARETGLDEFLYKFEQTLDACDLIKLSKTPNKNPKVGVGPLLHGDFGIIYAHEKLYTVQRTLDNEQDIQEIKPQNRKKIVRDLVVSYFEDIASDQSREALHPELTALKNIANREALDADIGESGKILSGGEKQKISILRGLFKKNRIWLMDEVTASLDAATANQILDALYERSEGVTCLMSNHKLQEVRQFADSIIVINKQGQCIGQGTHDTLLESCPLYLDLWNKCVHQQLSHRHLRRQSIFAINPVVEVVATQQENLVGYHSITIGGNTSGDL